MRHVFPAIATVLGLCACSGSSSTQAPADGSVPKDGAPDQVVRDVSAERRPEADGPPQDVGAPDTGAPAVRRIGRFDLSNPAQPTAEWSASAMEARFTGASVSATIGGANNYFAVFVDGAPEPELITNGSPSYPLAMGLGSGTHVVSVVRRDEAFDQPSALVGFAFGPGGALLPPPVTPSRRIEVIGDSISAGYGDECTNASQHFSASTENAYLAYGPTAARAVGADVHLIAWSGKGLYQNLDGSQTETMPILWQRTLPTDASSHWDASTWAPDAVVINLGTNDYSAPGPDPTVPFTSAYASFVATLRAAYPKAYIFGAVGPMLGGTPLNEVKGAIESVVAMRASAGDNAMGLIVFPTQNCGTDGSGCGCDYHPNQATHASMAKVVEAALHTALGW
jgi:hypothetical protein